MTRKLLWLFASGLMTLSLLIAACTSATPAAPTTTTTPPAPTTPTTPPAPTTTATPTTPVAPTAESPKYGGLYITSLTADPTGGDEAIAGTHSSYGAWLVQQQMMMGDWSRGPSGAGEFTWTLGSILLTDKVGAVAESFQILEPGHIVWKIRQGIHYGLNPNSEASRLVGGRELTAQDVVFSLKRLTTISSAYIKRTAPIMAASANFTAPDKYTVDLRCDPSDFYNAVYFFSNWSWADKPPEVVQKYGDMNNWKNVVGTGPFMLTDYVPGSQLTYVKNPNFWLTDPVGPGKGNKLPYLDGVMQLILPDASTRQAALRSGKIDQLINVSVEDTTGYKRTNPELKYTKYMDGAARSRIMFRIDKPSLPQYDIRVRKALSIAIDYNSILKDYFGGDGVVLSWPIPPVQPFGKAYRPLETLPADIQELFVFNTDKAKQLLKDAGYPNGFKIKVTTTSANVDYLAIIKDYWQKIGVDMQLDVKDTGVFNSIANARTVEEAIYQGGFPAYIRLGTFMGDNAYNLCMINDPFYTPEAKKLEDAYFAGDQNLIDHIYGDEVIPYVLRQAYAINTPASYTYIFWQPWIKNLNGAIMVGWTDSNHANYIWVDQELKKSKGR